jgi:hypothetical protein
VISSPDTYHVNQKVYRAFGSEEDRSVILNMVYHKDFDSLFQELDRRMNEEPNDERAPRREELRSYIEGGLEWLKGASLSRHVREKLLGRLCTVFSDRPFCEY